MSGGYVAVTVVFFVLAFILCLAAYHFYTKVSIKTMPINCVIWHIISLYMCVLPFPLLVVDIDAALSAYKDGTDKQEWMRPIWLAIFAVTYLCAWISLPVAQMYTEAGSFSKRGALISSIMVNLKLYAIIIVIVLVFFVYILIIKAAYGSFASIVKVGISLANAWGLLILILFMPAGLVGVPRSMFRYADAKRLLRRLLYDSVDIQEDLDLAAMDLAAVKSELMSIDPRVSDENRPHLSHMLELISQADRDIPQYHIAAQRVHAVPATDLNDVSLVHLEDLHCRLKHAIKVATRANYRWNSTVHKCQSMDEIVRGVKYTNNPIKKFWFPIRQYVYWSGCFVFSLITILILWSELVLPFRSLSSKPLSLTEVIMKSSVHFAGSVIILFYMAYCTYWAAFQFKVFDVYAVYPSIADNASLCFNETFLVRLLMPLCYNFLLISNLSGDADVDVMYGHVYRRNMDVGLLFGTVVNRFLPMVIPFIAAVVFFSLTQRLLQLVGVEIHDPNHVESPAVRQRIEDGRKLVESELGFQLSSVILPGEEGEPGPDGQTPRSSRINRNREGGEATTPQSRGARYKEYLEKKNAGQSTTDKEAEGTNQEQGPV